MARSDVRPASFRGEPFTVTSVETDGHARRVEVHEFPFRDTPWVEDFGKQARTYTLECHIAWDRRAALEEACAAPGPGALVHPFYGTLQVACTSCTSRDGTDSVGIARYTLTFRDQGVNQFPRATPNTGAKVDRAASDARGALQTSFVRRFDKRVPQWVTDSSAERVTSLGTAMEFASRLVHGGEGVAGFHIILRSLVDGAADLVADPSLLAQRISLGIQSLAGLSSDPLSTLRMLREFVTDFGSTFEAISGIGSRADEAEQQDAIVRMARSSGVVEAAVAARTVQLDSYNAAATLREEMVELFDGEITAAGDRGDDTALDSLLSVRAKLLEDLRERGGALATVRTLTLPGTVPAVVLAYRLYADPERDAEIVARNRVRHPGFIPAAVPLEVLSA